MLPAPLISPLTSIITHRDGAHRQGIEQRRRHRGARVRLAGGHGRTGRRIGEAGNTVSLVRILGDRLCGQLANYLPVALFSLKPSSATSSGGRTLITPTPFSIKMALLDALLRTQGKGGGSSTLACDPRSASADCASTQIVVINTFTKIVRPKKNGPSEDRGSGLMTPLGAPLHTESMCNMEGRSKLDCGWDRAMAYLRR